MPEVRTVKPSDIKLDVANLHREELISDLRMGSILRLVPIRLDGSDDPARKPMFIARTQILTEYGMLPLEAPIEAATLAEAVERFPQAVEQGMQDLARSVAERQREASKQIVTPDQFQRDMGGGKGLIL